MAKELGISWKFVLRGRVANFSGVGWQKFLLVVRWQNDVAKIFWNLVAKNVLGGMAK